MRSPFTGIPVVGRLEPLTLECRNGRNRRVAVSRPRAGDGLLNEPIAGSLSLDGVNRLVFYIC